MEILKKMSNKLDLKNVNSNNQTFQQLENNNVFATVTDSVHVD